MRVAGGAELDDVLERLRRDRPVFHSEADFQQAFGWALQQAMPEAKVRLETRPALGVRLDLLATSSDGALNSAIELKYLTRDWSGVVREERFELKNQGAQDIRAYDVIKDIGRVEHDTNVLGHCNGAVIVLSNEPSYWTRPNHERETNAAAFRIYDGHQLEGSRAWGPNTGPGTRRGREEAIGLEGSYRLRWEDYSRNPGTNGLFRLLVVEVAARADA